MSSRAFDIAITANNALQNTSGISFSGNLNVPSGNVGIGTTSPADKLDVSGGIRFTNGRMSQAYPGISFFPTSGTANTRAFRMEAGDGNFYILGQNDAGTTTTYPFYIKHGGNVGIGTGSPSSRFQVVDSNATVTRFKTTGSGAQGVVQVINSNTNGEASIGYRDDSDSDSTAWVVGKTVGGIADSFGFYYDGTKMTLSTSGNLGIGLGSSSPAERLHVGGSTIFQTASNTAVYLRNIGGVNRIDSYDWPITTYVPISIMGSYIDLITNDVVRARIAAAGLTFVQWRGTLDRGWDNYPAITILNTTDYGPQGEFRIHGAPGSNGGDYSINLRVDGSYLSGSDARRKANVETIDYALDKVMSLTGKSFNIINRDGNVEDTTTLNGRQFGLIAQEIENVIPEVVRFYPEADTPNANGWTSAYSVDYPALTALLIEAIKEQQGIINGLKQRIEILEIQ